MNKPPCNKANFCNSYQNNDLSGNSPMPENVILKTGNGYLPLRTIDFSSSNSINLNLPIASATVNTTCMDKPKLLIDFTGILNMSANITTLVSFNFALIRNYGKASGSQILDNFTFHFNYRLSSVTVVLCQEKVQIKMRKFQSISIF